MTLDWLNFEMKRTITFKIQHLSLCSRKAFASEDTLGWRSDLDLQKLEKGKKETWETLREVRVQRAGQSKNSATPRGITRIDQQTRKICRIGRV